jgi:hypothetical protein
VGLGRRWEVGCAILCRVEVQGVRVGGVLGKGAWLGQSEESAACWLRGCVHVALLRCLQLCAVHSDKDKERLADASPKGGWLCVVPLHNPTLLAWCCGARHGAWSSMAHGMVSMLAHARTC